MVDEEDDEEGAGVSFDLEALRGYVTYVKRALRLHLLVMALIGAAGLGLTLALAKYIPRTFTCTTVLMAQANTALERNGQQNLLDGAANLIMRHDNLEDITERLDLGRKFYEQRSAPLRLKDRIMERLRGKQSHKVVTAMLVGTLETKIDVKTEGNTLTINVDWPNGETAADIADAARESFVNARHTSEITGFEDKLAILDAHAQKTREEVEQLANQVRGIYGDRIAARAAASASAAASGAALAPRVTVPRPQGQQVTAETAELKLQLEQNKQLLEQKKARLADLESDHTRRLREEEAKLAELKLRLGPLHPDVVVQEQKAALAQQESGEIARLRDEVQALGGDVKQGNGLSPRRGVGGASRSAAVSAETMPDVLPPDIWRILEQEDIDPTLGAQLRGAVIQYGALRDSIRSGRVDVDTAQAAFNYRYKVIIPAEAPAQPSKPKLVVILLGGVAATLFFALLVPILLELNHGVVVARWQVQMMALPILGELRLPPASPPQQKSDTDSS